MSDPYLDEMMRRAKAKRDAIALTQSEAERLARGLKLQMTKAAEASPVLKAALDSVPVIELCDYILSGNHKRDQPPAQKENGE